MFDPIINLQKLTAPAAIIVSTAWVTTMKGVGEGFIFLLMTGFFYIILVLIEWGIYCDNYYHGRR